MPKFNNGIDSKVGFGQLYQANDLTSMIGGNAPSGSAIAGAGSSSASFNIGQTPASKWNPKGVVLTAGGGGISSSTVTGAVNGIIGMIQGYNSMQNAVKGTDELMAYSGQRTDLAFGVNYQAQNDINRQKAMDDISKSNKNATLGMVGSGAAAGASIGSAIPGVGTLIGGAVGAITGLFGGLFRSKKARERLRRKIFNAQLKVNLINLVNQSSAATEGLTLQYYLDNGNTYDDVLYANRGKDLRKPRYVKGK
ncbi:peptidoglycan-associated protein [uncultured phage cr7_1]|uniref:Peptidoglycan-associated protein n=1 Tax=uncultured phage cr7_1 TaxID=2772086 RepID=A0A7M1RSB0_9CAUD|nr:peptidoglycan-associated protein [uncultured phage cr7_1]QOR57327.1 peptidoglycan-associated protein [uncultured phage cr7_1]